MPAPKLNYEFNMEDPEVSSNIDVVMGLASSGLEYYWRVTRGNGLVHKYKSKVKFSYSEERANEISKFTMYHSPKGEVVTELPSSSI